MRDLMRRRPFWTAYGLAWAVALLVMATFALVSLVDPSQAGLLGDLGLWLERRATYVNIVSELAFAVEAQRPWLALVVVFAAAPTFAAFVTLAVTEGGKGLSRWASTLRPLGTGGSARPALLAYGLFFAVYLALLTWGVTAARGGDRFDHLWTVLGGSWAAAFVTALLGLLIDDGAFWEEMGWRGYFQPLLLEAWKKPVAVGVALGAAWALWHMPRDIPKLLAGQWGAFALTQIYMVALNVGMSLVIVHMSLAMGRSVWPGVLIHAGDNVLHKSGVLQPLYDRAIGDLPAHGVFQPGFLLRGLVWLALALAVVLATRAFRSGATSDGARAA